MVERRGPPAGDLEPCCVHSCAQVTGLVIFVSPSIGVKGRSSRKRQGVAIVGVGVLGVSASRHLTWCVLWDERGMGLEYQVG